MLKILLNGAKGRMGKAIMQIAPEQEAIICATIDEDGDAKAAIASCDIVIDFSVHNATAPLAELCAQHQKALIIGTTGHSSTDKERILTCTQDIAIVWAGNYSIGVNLLFYYTEKVAEKLSLDYQAEVVEMHHRHKKDAPSGTATDLVEAIKKARSLQENDICYGRHGITGERPSNEVGVHALRGGDVVGDHSVIFAGPGERFELSHKAADRSIFAQGAVRAAHWAVKQSAGLYNMRDVMGLH